MGEIKYKFENGIVKLTIVMTETEEEAYKASHGYPEMVEDEENPGQMKVNTQPIPIHFVLYYLAEMDKKMKCYRKEQHQEDIEECCNNEININPVEDKTL